MYAYKFIQWNHTSKMRVLLFTSAMLFILAACGSVFNFTEEFESVVSDSFQYKAISNTIILELLYSGDTTAAIQSLESEIDSTVILVWEQLGESTGTERKEAIRFLQSVKAFRERHPRTLKAPLDVDGELLNKMEKVVLEVEKILSGLDDLE